MLMFTSRLPAGVGLDITRVRDRRKQHRPFEYVVSRTRGRLPSHEHFARIVWFVPVHHGYGSWRFPWASYQPDARTMRRSLCSVFHPGRVRLKGRRAGGTQFVTRLLPCAVCVV
jgi:hypothetical protein